MYQRGIVHIIMIIIGLIIVAVLIGIFSMSSSKTSQINPNIIQSIN